MGLSERNLYLAFDDAYAIPGIIAMRTALVHSPPDVGVVVGSVGLSERARLDLHGTAAELDRAVTIVEVGDLVDGMPSGLPRFSSAAWARIFLDRIFPAETRRVVYLDADTYCRASIEDLFETDLKGRPLAAVTDPWEPTHGSRGRRFWSSADSPETAGYFNSGVMVVDVPTWKSSEVTERALKAIRDGRIPTRSVDQDVLNAVLWGDWLPLDETWNVPNIEPACCRARIVHFVGDDKPWLDPQIEGPFGAEYRRVAGRFGLLA